MKRSNILLLGLMVLSAMIGAMAMFTGCAIPDPGITGTVYASSSITSSTASSSSAGGGGGMFGLYTETYTVNVLWAPQAGQDASMDIWNAGFTLAPDTVLPGDGTVSLKLTALSSGPVGWGALSFRVDPTTAYKDLSAYASGKLHFMYKSTKSVTKIGVIDSLVPAGVYVTGAVCVSTYGMKTDGTWSSVVIPLSAFPGVTWSSIANYFVLVTDNANQVAGNVYNIDNVYYSTN